MNKKTKDEKINVRVTVDEKEKYVDALNVLEIKNISKDITEHIKDRIEEAEEFKQGNRS